MTSKDMKIIKDIANYYSDKLVRFGDTPKGVDWNGEASQTLRFEQLTKIIDNKKDFSLNDIGCGYAALFDYLTLQFKNFIYNGYDISNKMIEVAQGRVVGQSNVFFDFASSPTKTSDYSIASGIFNVRLTFDDDKWLDYIKSMLDILNEKSRLGFSFNCLTSYSDKDKIQAHLYYANPCTIFDFCKLRYSHNVALLHDYGLYEFTILVRK